jgi:capsular polysaccharide biosynthesis protein
MYGFDRLRIMIYRLKNFLKEIFVPKILGVSIEVLSNKDEDLIFPQEEFNLPMSLDLWGDSHSAFGSYTCVIPPFYVRCLENAKCIVGREEIFVGDRVVSEYSAQKKNPFIGTGRFRLRQPYRINARVANLSLSGLEDNYFHWLIECLGRFYLLERSRFQPDFYLLSHHLPFQKQLIQMLGIDSQKILTLPANTVVQADEVIVASFLNNWEPIEFRGHGSYQKQWLPHWIGNLYREQIKTGPEKFDPVGPAKIYISRALASYRSIENEAQILGLLRQKGYHICCLEQMSVSEQFALFANASIVLGAHGAGFANILFCRKNTIVCELFPKYYHDSSFRVLAHALDLRYHYMICDTLNIGVEPQKENIMVDLDRFAWVLDALEVLGSQDNLEASL